MLEPMNLLRLIIPIRSGRVTPRLRKGRTGETCLVLHLIVSLVNLPCQQAYEVNKEIEAKHVLFIDSITTNSNGKLGWMSALTEASQCEIGLTPRDLLWQLDSLGNSVCSWLDGALNGGVGIGTNRQLDSDDLISKAYASSQTSKVFWRSLIRPSLTVTSAVAPSYAISRDPRSSEANHSPR